MAQCLMSLQSPLLSTAVKQPEVLHFTILETTVFSELSKAIQNKTYICKLRDRNEPEIRKPTDTLYLLYTENIIQPAPIFEVDPIVQHHVIRFVVLNVIYNIVCLYSKCVKILRDE